MPTSCLTRRSARDRRRARRFSPSRRRAPTPVPISTQGSRLRYCGSQQDCGEGEPRAPFPCRPPLGQSEPIAEPNCSSRTATDDEICQPDAFVPQSCGGRTGKEFALNETMSFETIITAAHELLVPLGGIDAVPYQVASLCGVLGLLWLSRRLQIRRAREEVRRDPEIQHLARQWARRRRSAGRAS